MSIMNSRERVLAAFAHTEPDRVPRWCGTSPEFLTKAKQQLNLPDDESFFVRIGDDFRRVFTRYVGPEFPLAPGVVYRTVFGIDRAGYGYDRFIMPHLKRLIDLGHQYRLQVQLHCCGGYEPLIPSMIAAGLNGLHALQPCCGGMDLAKLKANYGSKILLNGAIDSHHVLISGTPESVRESTRQVLAIMTPGGGYVAGASHDYILEETPVKNVVAMFDAVTEFGIYHKA
jgi:uroporphyrinogen-III decarboxylase